MLGKTFRLCAWLLGLSLLACGATGQHELTFPVRAVGMAPRTLTVADWQVTLERAEVGLGPIYFCATAAIDPELCRTAVADFAQSAKVNLLEPAPQTLGEGFGVTAEIRGMSFDYGLSWLTTQGEVTPAASAPDGHSAVLVGRATRGATTFRFTANIDVTPLRQGGRGVNGLATQVTLADGASFTLRFDPYAWLAGVSFDELAALGGDPVVVPSSSRAYSAIVAAMTASAPPVVQWSVP